MLQMEKFNIRIKELKQCAIEDKIEFSEISLENFWKFYDLINNKENIKALFLSDNGNIRCYCEHDEFNYGYLEFCGVDTISYSATLKTLKYRDICKLTQINQKLEYLLK